jgi:hypothetical protein
MSDVNQQIIAQKTKRFLGGVQHLDQRILLEAEALQGAVDEAETRVAAWMFGCRSRPGA